MTDAVLVPEPDEYAVELLADRLRITEATARAALLLDVVAPGWEANVDPARLDMFSCDRCILGQQLGKHPYFEGCQTFEDALWRLGDAIGSRARVDDAENYNFSRDDYEWQVLIFDRRLA